jgi:outer membrane receptor for ferrienterochelin and colicins
MLRFFLALAFALTLLGMYTPAHAQTYTYSALVLDEHEEEPLFGVNVAVVGLTMGGATDQEGNVTISGIPTGRHTIQFSFVGFETVSRTYTFPLPDPDHVHVILMEESHGEMEEIAVSATRTSRTIADQPTRVETIAGEEIDEKISMEPANISMLLNESPGISIQQTSAVSGGASIRIQGLDGRYTQMLKDGFPLYGGFSGGLSLLQVPPLDLYSVEVIKGPSSTLYGGDAIAGLVNLVTKAPTEEPELSLLINGTTAGGADLGGFYQGRGERFGATFLASGNLQRSYDPDDDAFSNMPDTRRLTLNPKVFYYPSDHTTLSVGLSGTFEEREGGDMRALEDGPSAQYPFLERNESTRLTSQVRLDHELGERFAERLGGRATMTLKNSVSHFDRLIQVPDSRFSGRQLATYSELSFLLDRAAHDVVVGVDVRTDAFREDDATAAKRDYTYTSTGVFAQDTWDASERLVVETGLRAEQHNEFGLFVLPRASVLYRLTDAVDARVGGGLGYKAPTVFLEPSEERAFRGVAPLGHHAKAERSRGGSVDVNYQTLLFGAVALSFNQAFYFTTLDNPLVPSQQEGAGEPQELRYVSASGSIRTRAWETNAKLSYGDLKLFLGYVHLTAEAAYEGQEGALPLTATHKTYTVLVWEQHGVGRIGLEAYYTGPQMLSDGRDTDGYLISGIMAERRFGPARVFVNFENMLDTKQANYAPVVLGSRTSPMFEEIWAPMDGFVINGGVKWTL